MVLEMTKLCRFLRFYSATSSTRVWKNLMAPGYHEQFCQLFDTRMAVRTCKRQVAHEFQLPKQTRYVVPIELGKVERTVYDETLENALQSLHVDARGVFASDGWEMDISLLRVQLHRLRQVCTHPQIGGLQKGNDKVLGGALKTMEQVLEAMREQALGQVFLDRKKKVHSDLIREKHR